MNSNKKNIVITSAVRTAVGTFKGSLKNGKIFSLGIDVYNGEPNIHPEYLTLPNVFVLPHLGSATIKTRTAMGDLAISNIDEFFKTGKCKNKVN